jgi:hypothetical protein
MLTAMGAEGFAQPARRELQAMGETTRKRAIDVGGELTAQEAEKSEPASAQLTVALPDQAALLGVLDRLQTLGLTLCEVRRMSAQEW